MIKDLKKQNMLKLSMWHATKQITMIVILQTKPILAGEKGAQLLFYFILRSGFVCYVTV